MKNKKLIKSIAYIISGLGIVAPLPFTASSCWVKEPTDLKCDNSDLPGDIIGDINSSIISTQPLSGHIKTDTGISVSEVTFTCDDLKKRNRIGYWSNNRCY